MLLHTIHADKVFAESGVKGRIIIESPDSDVLVLCVHYFSKLQHTQELWFQTGTVSSSKDRWRYIPVHEICSTLSPVFTNILPAAHAVTGCDTTSSLFGIDKRSVFKVLNENPDNYKDLSNLADCDVEVSVTAARRLVIKQHDSKGKIKLIVLCSLVGKKDMDHSFLSTFKVKCHLTFYKILFALVEVKQSVPVVVCVLRKGCLAPTFVCAKQVKYFAIRTHKCPEIKA
jgi:hypothetical protein